MYPYRGLIKEVSDHNLNQNSIIITKNGNKLENRIM